MTDFIKDHYSSFSVPRDIVEVEKLPETPLMKVDFRLLTQNCPEDAVYDPPKGVKESLLPI